MLTDANIPKITTPTKMRYTILPMFFKALKITMIIRK